MVLDNSGNYMFDFMPGELPLGTSQLVRYPVTTFTPQQLEDRARVRVLVMSGEDHKYNPVHQGDIYCEHAQRWTEYFTREVELPPERVCHFDARGHSAAEQLLRIRCLVDETEGREIPVLVYQGHGLEGAITSLLEERSPHYKEIAEIWSDVKVGIVINDTCHSGTIIPSFENRDLVRSTMLLTSCGPTEISWGTDYTSIYSQLIRDVWRQGRPARIEKHGFPKIRKHVLELVAKNSSDSDLVELPIVRSRTIFGEGKKFDETITPMRVGPSLDYLLMPVPELLAAQKKCAEYFEGFT